MRSGNARTPASMALLALTLCASAAPVAAADPPAPASTSAPASTPAWGAAAPAPSASPSHHTYDPCEMASQQDVASAAGVAANEVYTPKSPTTDECVWAIGNKSGVPAQQIALTFTTVEQVQKAHGIARFGTVLKAVQSIPGVPAPNNPVVTRAFADAQTVVDLGDRAGWKNGTLSVLKGETLFQVNAIGQNSDAQSLKISKAVAKTVLSHMQTQ